MIHSIIDALLATSVMLVLLWQRAHMKEHKLLHKKLELLQKLIDLKDTKQFIYYWNPMTERLTRVDLL